MHRCVGWLDANKGRPHVYAILKGYCLYIGETVGHPATRLAQHLGDQGTFRKALMNFDEDLALEDRPVFFVAFECERVAEEVAPVQYKPVVRYIEHALQRRILARSYGLGWEIEVISNTDRTAPTRCQCDWADQLADRIFADLVQSISGKLS